MFGLSELFRYLSCKGSEFLKICGAEGHENSGGVCSLATKGLKLALTIEIGQYLAPILPTESGRGHFPSSYLMQAPKSLERPYLALSAMHIGK